MTFPSPEKARQIRRARSRAPADGAEGFDEAPRRARGMMVPRRPTAWANPCARVQDHVRDTTGGLRRAAGPGDRKSTRLNSSHEWISYAVFCLKKKKKTYYKFYCDKKQTTEKKQN